MGYRTQCLSPSPQHRRCGPFPSLPAGINTDDSDPLGAGVGACHIAPLHGAACPPRFGGGRYRLPRFFCIVIMEA